MSRFTWIAAVLLFAFTAQASERHVVRVGNLGSVKLPKNKQARQRAYTAKDAAKGGLAARRKPKPIAQPRWGTPDPRHSGRRR